jgi:hypothetical protein
MDHVGELFADQRPTSFMGLVVLNELGVLGELVKRRGGA